MDVRALINYSVPQLILLLSSQLLQSSKEKKIMSMITISYLTGPWQQDAEPLYGKDGGHCMTFYDFEGNTWLSFHHPDGHPNERPKFMPLNEDKLASARTAR